jgi:hypothetical protein
MATFIHGIAASENIDSSGERISIAGMDISSLEKDGVFNYEHESGKVPDKDGRPVELQIKIPAQIVGKILKARKIFSEEDAEDEHQLYFWRKIQTPYLYVMGELFDDYTDAARDLAGKFRYDQDKKGQNERYVNNFSIEGGKIQKVGMEVPRSVARKVTITSFPCNKAAIAEMIVSQDKKKDDLDSIFKTESVVEIELFNFKPEFAKAEQFKVTTEEDMKKHAEVLGIEPMNKSLPIKTAVPGMAAKPAASPTPGAAMAPKLPSPTNNPGSHLGSTKSGKKIFSHAKIHEYRNFSMQDHDEAAAFHRQTAEKTKDPVAGKHHWDKMRLHLDAARTAERKLNRFAVGRQQAANRALGKSLDAGSAMAAPSQLTGGAALGKEDVSGPGKNKKKWLARAEQEYENWGKKEVFREFMKKRLPNLALGEIDAIGKTLALKKSIDAEKALSNLVKKEKK